MKPITQVYGGNNGLCIRFNHVQKMGYFRKNHRNYCALGKISGAFLTGKTWNIPEHAERPDRINKRLPTTLLEILQTEMDGRLSGGIYHKVQIELTYNSNHIEGSKLTHDQTQLHL